MRRLAGRIACLVVGTGLGMATLPPAVAVGAELLITVDGAPLAVPPDTTVGLLLERLGRVPPKGNLVSVNGRVLRPGVVSGRTLVNGSPVTADAPVTDGDAIVLERGPDVREPTERTLAPAVGVGNPIRTIPPHYGAIVYAVRGTISHEVIHESARPGLKVRSAVALTFDDGPDPIWTRQILSVLARYGVKATFFVVGRNVARYPWVVRAIRAGGHAVQNHSWAHENLGRTPFARQRASLIANIRELRKMNLPFPKWFRPPYGSYTIHTLRLARWLGMRTAIWSSDASDYSRPSPRTIARRVLARIQPGGVILLHDGGGPRGNTVAALPVIIEALLHRGYRFVTLD